MDFKQVITYVICAIGGFLLGSVQFCRIIPHAIKKVDVCALSDDGNPGAANAFKHCGVLIGSVCLILDILKGFAPAFLAIAFLPVNNAFFSLVMFAPVLGHAVGIFNDFNGGKCIATSFGVVAATFFLTWIGVILAVTYIIVVGLFKTEHRSGSIITFSIFAVSAFVAGFIVGMPFVGIGFLIISITAIIKHLPKHKTGEPVDDISVVA